MGYAIVSWHGHTCTSCGRAYANTCPGEGYPNTPEPTHVSSLCHSMDAAPLNGEYVLTFFELTSAEPLAHSFRCHTGLGGMTHDDTKVTLVAQWTTQYFRRSRFSAPKPGDPICYSTAASIPI